jgi:signal transduction histidine kinase
MLVKAAVIVVGRTRDHIHEDIVLLRNGCCRPPTGGETTAPSAVPRCRRVLPRHSAACMSRVDDKRARGPYGDVMSAEQTWDRRIGAWASSRSRFAFASALLVGALQIGGQVVAARGQHGGSGQRSLDLLAFGLLAVGPAALIARRQAPRTVLAVIMAVTVLYYLLGYPNGPAFLSLIVALFTTVMGGHRLFAWITAVVGLVAYAGAAPVVGLTSRTTPIDYLGVTAWLLVVLIGSEAARVRRDGWVVADNASREESRRRASEERLQIARDLHDELAHNISLINVRAGVGLHLFDEQPDEARNALQAIKGASKDALDELRSVLAVLRQGEEPAPRSPAPGLDHLERLVSDAGRAGLAVSVQVDGGPDPIPKALDQAAFRIVQESLTNVRRHSRASATSVQLTFADRELVVRIDDDGPAAAGTDAGVAGSGIRGMRERAVALGGTLEAAPRTRGGFTVLARMPIENAR